MIFFKSSKSKCKNALLILIASLSIASEAGAVSKDTLLQFTQAGEYYSAFMKSKETDETIKNENYKNLKKMISKAISNLKKDIREDLKKGSTDKLGETLYSIKNNLLEFSAYIGDFEDEINEINGLIVEVGRALIPKTSQFRIVVILYSDPFFIGWTRDGADSFRKLLNILESIREQNKNVKIGFSSKGESFSDEPKISWCAKETPLEGYLVHEFHYDLRSHHEFYTRLWVDNFVEQTIYIVPEDLRRIDQIQIPDSGGEILLPSGKSTTILKALFGDKDHKTLKDSIMKTIKDRSQNKQ